MTSKEILTQYFAQLKENGHKETPNVSLVPEGDSTLLFVNSGMFPLVPYLSGEVHPLGKRLMNFQRSLRSEDIEEIGDPRHTTCFHMIGNWSLGDYFKKEQLNWIYTLLIEKLGLDPNRLYPTIFEGDEFAPKDDESVAILEKIFAKHGVKAELGKRIFAHNRKENWWQRGDAVGELGGPDSEVFYYLGKGEPPLGKDPADFQDDFLEIGNSVFMQYKKIENGWEELPQKNVDFGGGLERIAMVVQKKDDIFETDNFAPIIKKVEELSGKKYHESLEINKAMRVLADHIRAATLLAMDGVLPANKDQGYAMRRYLRRLVSFSDILGIKQNISAELVDSVVETIGWIYPNLAKEAPEIKKVFIEEENKFRNTLAKGTLEMEHMLVGIETVNVEKFGEIVFNLKQSHGIPYEISLLGLKDRYKLKPEVIKEIEEKAQIHFEKHQSQSRSGAEQKFKGGLADHSEMVVKYHTTTHLLHQALRKILGPHVQQFGSNITGERLRFDFAHPDKLTDAQIAAVEEEINGTIAKKLPVNFVILPKEKAVATGALHFFKEKYPEQVKVYFIGPSLEEAYSKEFCGGPHVENLSVLSPTVKLYKQEAIGKGVRRVYLKFS